jgi:hypothetical protein
MSSLSLHIVLLCAVAYSQIFGGVSCCCLSRSIWVGSQSTSESSPSSERGLASTNAPPVPQCPRCAASKSLVEKSSDANGVDSPGSAAGNECQCAKAASHVAVQLEPRAQHVSVRRTAGGARARSSAPLRRTFLAIDCLCLEEMKSPTIRNLRNC